MRSNLLIWGNVPDWHRFSCTVCVHSIRFQSIDQQVFEGFKLLLGPSMLHSFHYTFRVHGKDSQREIWKTQRMLAVSKEIIPANCFRETDESSFLIFSGSKTCCWKKSKSSLQFIILFPKPSMSSIRFTRTSWCYFSLEFSAFSTCFCLA